MSENNLFYDLSVQLPPVRRGLDSSLVDIYSCLDMYFADEIVEGVECLNCTFDHELRRHLDSLSALDIMLGESSQIPAPTGVCQAARGDARRALESLRQMAASTKSGSETASLENLALVGVVKPVVSNYSKRFVITKWPQVICFHFSRLSYDIKKQTMQKNRSIVRFPIVLSSIELMKSTRSVSPPPSFYTLKAVIVHHGGANSGAYLVIINVLILCPDIASGMNQGTILLTLADPAKLLILQLLLHHQVVGITSQIRLLELPPSQKSSRQRHI